MSNKTTRNRVLCLVFLAIFFAATVLIFPAWAVLKHTTDWRSRESRPIAGPPVYGETPLELYPAAFEAYLADNAPFRNQWMTFNAQINMGLFNSTQSSSIVVGKNGWLFLNNGEDAQPIADYQGINHYSDVQLQNIAENLDALQKSLERQGCQLVLTFAPNKSGVHTNYMPSNIPVINQQGKIDVLVDYIANNTAVPVVWPKAQLRSLAQTQQLYYKYDTHWNNAGAAVACSLLLEKIGVPVQSYGQLTFEQHPIAEDRLFDLANVAALWPSATNDVDYMVQNWAPGVTAQRVFADDKLEYENYTSNAEDARKLLVLRDSFGTAMVNFLSSSFQNTAFVHLNAFSPNTISAEAPDVFILEFSERFSDRLLDWLPRLVEWTA